MASGNREFDNPTAVDDATGPGDTLSPMESTDADEVKNRGGDEVVDPPEQWFEADTVAAQEPERHESLDDKLAAEEPDTGDNDALNQTALDIAPPDVQRDVGHHRGQVGDTPEDGESLFPLVNPLD